MKIPHIIPSIFFAGTGIILLMIFMMAFKLDQNDRRTKLYLFFMMLLAALTGLGLHFGNRSTALSLPTMYIPLKIFFLVVGVFHFWFMYKKLFWSKRDTYTKEQDSFFPELVYTLCIQFLMSVSLLTVYGYFAGFEKMINYWAISILFIVPFLFAKSYDFLNQIPQKDFSKKWLFTKERIGEDNWNWVNKTWVYFAIKEDLKGEWRKKGRYVNFRIEVPRLVPIREIFRLAIREHNNMRHDVIIQDLGFEESNKDRFWWLFSVKWIWNRPSTWFRTARYLNPYKSVIENEILPHDIILATRMSLKEDINFDDNYDEYEDIPMGELM